MADEQSRTPFNRVSPIPKGFGWDVLVKLDGDELETHYRHSLTELGKRPGLIGVIFRKAQNKIQDPAAFGVAPGIPPAKGRGEGQEGLWRPEGSIPFGAGLPIAGSFNR